ncbi:3-methyl-2-oxobutanoate hydroxymethyltransferase [Desulfothermus okinawensis JCM 13304]
MDKPLTIPEIISSKSKNKLTMLTAYDYPTALIVDRCGIDMILVGDSLAMVVLGHKDTLSVTMDQMIHHTKAVTGAVKRAVVIGDMPFMSYQASVEQAVINAGRFLKEGGAQAVKLEGGATVLPQIKAIINAGIPVQGHLGLTPQSAAQLGGFKVQGKTAEAAKKLVDDALAIADAGCFSIVLEAIPAPIAEVITEKCPVPTIGIGAGPSCDGQVLVFHDLVGLFDRFVPKFVKQYTNISKEIERAILEFKDEVKTGKFPGKEHSFSINEEELKKIK